MLKRYGILSLILLYTFSLLMSPLLTNAQDGDFSLILEPINEENIKGLHPLETLTLDDGIRDIDVMLTNEGYNLAVASGFSVYMFKITLEANLVIDELNTIESLVPPSRIFFSESDSLIAINNSGQIGPNDQVVIWNIETGEQIRRFDLSDAAWDAEISPDGERIAVGYSDGSVCLANLERRMEETCLLADEYDLWPSVSLSFSSTESLLAVGNSYDGLQLWDLEAEELILSDRQTMGGFGPVVAFSPNGQYLVIAHDDGRPVLVYDMIVADFEPVSLEPSNTFGVYRNTLVFTSDSEILISNEQANNIWFWNVETRQQIDIINIDEAVPSVAKSDPIIRIVDLSSDDCLLITGDTEGNIIIWGVPQESTP